MHSAHMIETRPTLLVFAIDKVGNGNKWMLWCLAFVGLSCFSGFCIFSETRVSEIGLRLFLFHRHEVDAPAFFHIMDVFVRHQN